MQFLKKAIVPTLLAIASSLNPTTQAGDTYKWTVQYLVDNSETIFGSIQKVWPRRNRGLALSPDGKHLYAGYHHGGNGVGEIRKIAIGITDEFGRATVRVLPGPLGKAITTDDKGRVYIANEGEILIYDADLGAQQHSIQAALCEGVAVTREGKDLVLYTSDRQLGTLRRWVLEEKGAVISGATQAGFGGSGEVIIKNAQSLRGVEVDPKGNIWVADEVGGRVFRVSKDGKTVESADARGAMDIAFDGERAFVSRGRDRVVAVFNAEKLELIGNLAVPWEELEITPVGNNRHGSLSAIVAVAGKGFLVTNESGQTANQKSTYGRADAQTDIVDGKIFRDAFGDDNEPILRAFEAK